MTTDPIADMLARIRNAALARHPDLACPASNTKLAIARVLVDAGFLSDARVEARDGRAVLLLRIGYAADGRPLLDGLRRISRPSRRVYVGKDEVPRVRNGLGVAVISTSKGILSDQAAREAEVGGELLCEAW
jgi:small subunit ribosomal protein S8